MPYFTLLSAIFSVSIIFTHFVKIQIFVTLVEFALYITVHVIGMRSKRYHVYGMLFLFSVRMIVLCSQQFMRSLDPTIDVNLALGNTFDVMVQNVGFFFFCAVPNTAWLCCYVSIYFMAIVVLGVKFVDYDSKTSIQIMTNQPLRVLGCILIYHIAQSLRLNRFFKERRLQIQGNQMSDIFESQSDAILAFEKVDVM